jgi:hypothetical protein
VKLLPPIRLHSQKTQRLRIGRGIGQGTILCFVCFDLGEESRLIGNHIRSPKIDLRTITEYRRDLSPREGVQCE